MAFKEKLETLRRLQDTVSFRWLSGRSKTGGAYIRLPDLRLVTMSCGKGAVVYSSAAPVLHYVNGRPEIVMRDSNVVTVVDGERRGAVLDLALLRDGETAMEAQDCAHRVITEGECPKYIQQRIASLAQANMVFPVTRVIMPELYRLCQRPERLKPMITTALVRELGLPKTASVEQITRRFRDNLERFGVYVDGGYIVPFDRVVSGGQMVASGAGIPCKTGGAVHTMPLSMFVADMKIKGWSVATVADLQEEDER